MCTCVRVTFLCVYVCVCVDVHAHLVLQGIDISCGFRLWVFGLGCRFEGLGVIVLICVGRSRIVVHVNAQLWCLVIRGTT